MESCCRACSRSDDFRRFSLYAVAEVSQEVIANMIRDTSDTQVSTEDGLPQQICPDCLMTLSLAYSFRKQCRRSDAKFREYWGGRTPSQSVDQQQHQQQQQPHQQSQQHQLPRRSQSHVPDEGSFEAVATTIKEEVDIYDYEYSVPSGGHDNQWVIQNPRTIGEGAMTVVHNTGGQYYDEAAAAAAIAAGETGGSADRDGHSMIHPMDDPSEMGESSGLGQKNDDKLKKNVPNAERYSQRIRRQMPAEQTATTFNVTDASTRTPKNEERCREIKYLVTDKPQMQSTNKTCGQKRPVDKQLTEALTAIQKGMKVSAAAARFNIPYKTIYNRAQHCGIIRPKCSTIIKGSKNWTSKQMTDALQTIKEGMSFTKAAIIYNIPLATLYTYAKRFGVRNVQRKRSIADDTNRGGTGGILKHLPDESRRKRRWTEEQMSRALEAIQKGMTILKASTEFNIPRKPIDFRVKNLHQKSILKDRKNGRLKAED